MLLLDGAEHMRERKTLLPPFHGERMQAYGDLIREIAEAEVATWPVGEPLAMRPRMQALTLEIIMRAVFGTRDERLRAHARDDCSTGWADPARLMFVVARRAEAERARVPARMRAPVDDLLARRSRSRRTAPDLARAPGHPLDAAVRPTWTTRTLRDELLTLLVAGHETTATALAWALERLARHPARGSDCARRTRTTSTPSCKETLRLRPVVPAVLRMLKAPFELARPRRSPRASRSSRTSC